MQEFYLNNEIYYRKNDWQPGRPTLVLAHGVSGSSSAWWPYEKIFENKYNVLTYDIRGHGLSKKYSHYEDYDIKNFANDLHELVVALQVPKFILVSNSFAGLIHLEYLKQWGDTVVANVFTSPEIFLNTGTSAKFMRPALSVITTLASWFPFNPKPRGQVDYKKYLGSTDWSVGRNLADIRNTGLRAHFYTLQQSLKPEQTYDLSKINVPTLILHGEKDTMVPIKNAVRMSQEIKNAQFISIPKVDHNTVHNAVKEMSGAIEAFIEKNKNLVY